MTCELKEMKDDIKTKNVMYELMRDRISYQLSEMDRSKAKSESDIMTNSIERKTTKSEIKKNSIDGEKSKSEIIKESSTSSSSTRKKRSNSKRNSKIIEDRKEIDFKRNQMLDKVAVEYIISTILLYAVPYILYQFLMYILRSIYFGVTYIL